ncbi:MAG TPA: formylglycine-generating enzyme family protein [Solirubrobacteraceae bacterium]
MTAFTQPRTPAKDMVWVPDGEFTMGSGDFYPEEGPVRRIAVDGFWIDEHPVTVAEFRRFVKATGHQTTAELTPAQSEYPNADPELLVPGSLVFEATSGPVDLRDFSNWWAWTPGAFWRRPEGPESNVGGRERHPVVHVSYGDALAYARWSGKDLPTEAEWERAARGGLEQKVFAWGDEFAPRGRMMANTWQGEFPWQNLMSDGFARTSPVRSFAPNGFGLYDITGNTWEWTSDWFSFNEGAAAGAEQPSCCVPRNPRVDSEAQSYGPGERIPRKVIKGGSHLCAPNYCLRYRPAARQSEAIDTSTSHIGFRCVLRLEGPATRS